MGMGRPSMLYVGGTLVLQRYLARITPSDPQAKGHLAAKLSDCTPASRSLARPQETSNVVVLGCAVVDERWVNMMLLHWDTQAVEGST